MARWDFPGTDPVDVQVSISSGHLEITAGPTDGLVVTAEPGRSGDPKLLDDLQVTFADGRLDIRQERLLGWRRSRSGLDISVTVPAGSSCTAKTADADVSCDGEFSSINSKTASGDFTAEQVSGAASAVTASGEIRLGLVQDAVSASTASGEITVREAAGDVRCNTASGDIQIGTAGGSVDAKTASGDVSIARVAAGKVSLATVSGDLDIGVAPGLGLYLELSTLSGRISNELGDSDGEQIADVRLTCRTVSGDVRVHRAGEAA